VVMMVAVALACTSTPSPAPEALLPVGWVGEIAQDPTRFSNALGDSRDGWIALHQGALADATRGGGAPAERARAAEAQVEDAMAFAGAAAWRSLKASWEQNGTLPPDSPLFVLTTLADASVPPPTELPEPIRACQAAHEAARSGAGPLPSSPVCPDPLVLEADGQRSWPDPQVHATRAALARRDAAPSSGWDGLLFSGAWTKDDRDAHGTVELNGPSLRAIGVDLRPGESDDPDAALVAVAALDSALGDWRDSLSGTDDGLALIQDLDLVRIYRAQLLAAAARAQLDAAHPRAASALVRVARDLNSPRELGPVNRPQLAALAAWGALETGRTREALDALAPLRTAWPHSAGLVAVVEDLAVLEGMTRLGDSRER
jgi:hypothetical protein